MGWRVEGPEAKGDGDGSGGVGQQGQAALAAGSWGCCLAGVWEREGASGVHLPKHGCGARGALVWSGGRPQLPLRGLGSQTPASVSGGCRAGPTPPCEKHTAAASRDTRSPVDSEALDPALLCLPPHPAAPRSWTWGCPGSTGLLPPGSRGWSERQTPPAPPQATAPASAEPAPPRKPGPPSFPNQTGSGSAQMPFVNVLANSWRPETKAGSLARTTRPGGLWTPIQHSSAKSAPTSGHPASATQPQLP